MKTTIDTISEKSLRTYILTEKEREIIETYLEKGLKLEGFNMLLHRCKQLKDIHQDLELIQKFLEKNK